MHIRADVCTVDVSVKQRRNVTWNSQQLTLRPDKLILASYSLIKIRQNLKQLKYL